jgi:hypothetical protein
MLISRLSSSFRKVAIPSFASPVDVEILALLVSVLAVVIDIYSF